MLVSVKDKFSALGDGTRLEIISALASSGEMYNEELVEHLGIAQNLISHHVKTLKADGIIAIRKEGRYRYYSLIPGWQTELIEYLRDLSEVAQEENEGSEI